MREKTLESAIIKFLELRGYYTIKIHSGGVPMQRGSARFFIRLGDEGSPDIITCIRGLFVAIEVKKDAEELGKWERQWERYQKTRITVKSSRRSIAQHLARERIKDAGGIHIACADFETLQRDVLEVERIAREERK